MVGLHTHKICASCMTINKCNVYNKKEKYKQRKAEAPNEKERTEQYKNKIKSIAAHHCLNNFDGTSKAMEADSFVHLILKFPQKYKAYVCGLVMDDDTTTPCHLREDTGPGFKGGLPKCLTGIIFYADPSHQKCIIGGMCYKTAEKKESVSRITNAHAAKLKKHFGCWQNQTRQLTFAEMKKLKDVPILHATGDHSICNSDWCHSKKAQENGTKDKKKPMFSLPKDVCKIEQIKTIHESFTTDEEFREMHHPWSTQVNESLNMRLTELAPKYKHFSQSSTLQHRVTVISIHNLGYKAF